MVTDPVTKTIRPETVEEMATAVRIESEEAATLAAQTAREARADRLQAYRSQVGDEVDVMHAVLEGLDALSKGEALPAGARQALAKVREIKAR